MKKCAEKGKGHFVFINDDENPSKKIIQLLIDSFSPAITTMELKFDEELVDTIIPNPKQMPYVLKN